MNRYVSIFVLIAIIFVSGYFYISQHNNEQVELVHFRKLPVDEGKHYIIENVNIISMVNDVILYNQSIIVESGIITKIMDYRKVENSVGAEIIDGYGMYLMPGLFDMHVHTNQIQSLEAFLAYGVTSIRDMMGTDIHLKWKENIAYGKVLGPEMTVGTMLVDGENPTWPQSIVITDVTEVALFIKHSKEQGYDFIKIYDKLTKAVFDEIMEQSKALDIPVAGHIPYSVSAHYASLAGLWSSEHLLGHGLEYMREEAIKTSIAELVLSDLWISPTPYIYKYQLLDDLSYVDIKKYMKAFHDEGGKIVLGTDAFMDDIPAGISLHESLQIMVEAGFTPYEALETATINPANMLEIGERVGTIEVGKEADFVLLGSNPLEDISNTMDIRAVMTKGRLLDSVWIRKKGS